MATGLETQWLGGIHRNSRIVLTFREFMPEWSALIRTKDGREIDFLVLINNHPHCLIESKWADDAPSKNFLHYEAYFPEIKKFQLVKELKREKTFPGGLEVREVARWLYNIDFSSAIKY